MTRDLPSLEEPAPGSECPDCGEPIRVERFCAPCFERSMQAREAAIAVDLATARRKARAWQLGRGVSA